MLTKELNTTDRPQLAFIEPMQVAPVRELPDGGNWTYEVKFDGYRCLAAKRSGGVLVSARFTGEAAPTVGTQLDEWRNEELPLAKAAARATD